MLRLPSLLFATFGLAVSLTLWSVPAFVLASAAPHVLWAANAPQLSQLLATTERQAGPTPSLPDGLLQLIGAESEAMQVAGDALQQPAAPDLAARATHSGARTLDAVHAYIRAAAAALNQLPSPSVRTS